MLWYLAISKVIGPQEFHSLPRPPMMHWGPIYKGKHCRPNQAQRTVVPVIMSRQKLLPPFLEGNSVQVVEPLTDYLVGQWTKHLIWMICVHRTHLRQIHFSGPSVPNVELDNTRRKHENPSDIPTEVPFANSASVSAVPLLFRKSFR